MKNIRDRLVGQLSCVQNTVVTVSLGIEDILAEVERLMNPLKRTSLKALRRLHLVKSPSSCPDVLQIGGIASQSERVMGIRRAVRECGESRQPGHTASTCPSLAADRATFQRNEKGKKSKRFACYKRCLLDLDTG